jgi:hypothetical protein
MLAVVAVEFGNLKLLGLLVLVELVEQVELLIKT